MATKTTQAKKASARKAPPRSAPGPAPTEVTAVSKWKQSAQGKPMELPSGNVAKVRNPGLQAFLREGMVPNALMPVVQAAIDEHKAPDPREIMDQPNAIQDTITMIDNIWMFCVTEPLTQPIPEQGEERLDEVLYVDEVDMEDKIFVFQYIGGGTTDLERFREERAASMASLQSR